MSNLRLRFLFTRIRFLITSLILLLVSCVPLAALGAERPVDRFVSTLQINTDTSLDVVEMITFKDVAPTIQMEPLKIVRRLPRHYTSKRGLQFNTEVSVRDIVDATQTPVPFEVSTNADNTEVTIAGDSRPHQVYRFHYQLRGAIEFVKAQPDLSWFVVGSDWPTTIDDAEALVYLPENMDLVKVDPSGFRGEGFNVKAEAFKAVDGIAIRAFKLRPHEALHYDILMPDGLIRKPPPTQALMWSLSDHVGDVTGWWPALLIPLVVGLFLYLFIWRGKAEETSPFTPGEIWEPLPGLPPAIGRVLVVNDCDSRALLATIVDLAIRGYITIVQPSDEPASCELRQGEIVDRSGLLPYEQVFMDNIFAGTACVNLELLKSKFAKLSEQVGLEIDKELMSKQFVHSVATPSAQGSDSHVGSSKSALLQAAIIWAGVLSIAGGIAVLLQQFAAGGGLLISGFLVGACAPYMPNKTIAGARVAAHTRHFKSYSESLKPSDMEELGKADPQIFERLLPFAMVADASRAWAAKSEPYMKPSGSWFIRGDHSNPTFSTRVETLEAALRLKPLG